MGDYGLARRAMNIYKRAAEAVESEDRFEMYEVLVAKTAANFGLPSTRSVYEKAIEVLPDRQTSEMCLRFAAMERKLGEIDRARAIYAHGSPTRASTQRTGPLGTHSRSRLGPKTLSESTCVSSELSRHLSTRALATSLHARLLSPKARPPLLLQLLPRLLMPLRERQRTPWRLWKPTSPTCPSFQPRNASRRCKRSRSVHRLPRRSRRRALQTPKRL